jgi:hypothetical protein
MQSVGELRGSGGSHESFCGRKVVTGDDLVVVLAVVESGNGVLEPPHFWRPKSH